MSMENDPLFMLFKTMISVAYTLGMMMSLSNFKYSWKRILGIFSIYLFYVMGSTVTLLLCLDWVAFLRIAFFTISVPAILIAYLIAKDSPMQAVFNYMTQIDLMLYMTFTVTLVGQATHASKEADLFMRAAIGVSVIFIELRFFRKPFLKLTSTLRENWLPMALIPCSFCVIIMVTLLYPVHFTQNPSGVVFLYLILLVMIVVYWVVFQSLLKSNRLFTALMENNIMEAQLSAQKQHYETKLGNEAEIHRLKHDMQGHFATIAALLADEKTAEATAYLEKLTELNKHRMAQPICDNPYLSAVISIFMDRFHDSGIVFQHQIQFENLTIPAPTLCLILHNALQNAMEATLPLAAEKRTVHLQVALRQAQLLIRISNPFQGTLHTENGLPVTTKKERGHGYGLSSIRSAVEQLGGDISYSAHNGIFILNLSIPHHVPHTTANQV